MKRFGVTGSNGKQIQERLDKYYDGNGDLKEGYIISKSPTELYERADKVTMPSIRQRTKSTVNSTPGDDIYIYKKPQEKAEAPAPKPKPKPAPKPVKKEPEGPVEYSSEIQQAISRVRNYESPFGGASTSTEDRGYSGFSNLNQVEQEDEQKQEPQVNPQSFLDKYKMDFKMKPAVNDVSVGA